MDIAVLFSGGKDSCYTIMKSIDASLNVKVLLTLYPKSEDSWLFHHPCIRWTKLQAEAMNLQIAAYNIESEGEDEKLELSRHIQDVKNKFGIEGIAAGALASQYQRRRIEDITNDLGLEIYTPLWGLDPSKLLLEQLESGLEIIIVGTAALGLDSSWLGRRIDKNLAQELDHLKEKHGVNPAGEGGEYETFVIDGPLFQKKITIKRYHKTWKGDSGQVEIDVAELKEKTGKNHSILL
jgi:ABC transporter with metal-binding/Fe-S-binding domain ATP-binding protein